MIKKGSDLVKKCVFRGSPGRYDVLKWMIFSSVPRSGWVA